MNESEKIVFENTMRFKVLELFTEYRENDERPVEREEVEDFTAYIRAVIMSNTPY